MPDLEYTPVGRLRNLFRPSSTRPLRAGVIEIVDEHGRVRLRLGDLGAGAFGVRIAGDDLNTRLWLAVEPTGPVVALGRDGNVLAEVGVHDPGPEMRRPGPYAYLADGQGTARWGLWLDDPPGMTGEEDETHDL